MPPAGPRLQVLIATHRPEGIGRVAAMHLPQIDQVGYIVSWQNHGNTPLPAEIASRPDIEVCRLDQPGVSRNRNNAFDHATAPLVLVADDDLEYNPEALKQIISIFDNHPELDFATFRYDGPDQKSYPAAVTPLNPRPSGFCLTAFEFAMRRNDATAHLRFREDFGPGAPRYIAGEDDMLLIDAGRLRLRGAFFPLTIARHPALTTGFRAVADPRVAQTTGAILRADNPRLRWLPRIPLTAWRLWRAGRMPLLSAMRHLTIGAIAFTDKP